MSVKTALQLSMYEQRIAVHVPLELVKQENKSSGCGIACIAMLAGISYSSALKYVFPNGKTLGVYTYYFHLKRALSRLGIAYSAEKPARTWDKIIRLESTSIVACNYKNAEIWHWVVFDVSTRLILDPLKDEPMKANQLRRQPISYLPITGLK